MDFLQTFYQAKKNKQVTEVSSCHWQLTPHLTSHFCQFKTFDLTPAVKQSVKDKRSSKRVKEEQEKGKEENGSEEKDEDKGTTVGFEPRPDCLQAILHNQPILEVGCQSFIQPPGTCVAPLPFSLPKHQPILGR